MVDGPTILHADLDAFYASVEQLLQPELRGLPIAVGGGVVLAASYEARRFGVSGGMSGFRAKQLCPSLVFVDGHFREYQRISEQVMTILGDVTPLVQQISIDEAFLDVSGSVRLFGPPGTIAESIRRRVHDEVGLSISVGAARTKHLAKIASQVAKPDGLVIVDPCLEREFLDPLPVGLVWGVGPVTEQRLADRGIRTIGELARSSPDTLESLLGRALGAKVGALAANEDRRKVERNGRSSSVGAQSAFGRRELTPEFTRRVLGHLADRVAGRLRASRRAGRTITIRIRFAAPRSAGTAITRSRTVADAIDTTLTLMEVAAALVEGAVAKMPTREVSLLAVSVSNLVERPTLQLELPVLPDEAARPGSVKGAARWAVDHSIDDVRRRFGRAAVGYAASALSADAMVPDEFRELAEHDR